MGEVKNIRTATDRPDQRAFINALNNVVEQFACKETLTYAEILGCIDYVSKSYFAEVFNDD